MNIKKFSLTMLAIGISMSSLPIQANNHPNLILTEHGVERMRDNLGQVPLFDKSLAVVKQEVDAEIELGIDTPIPKDFSGGYTHQRHKQNFFIAQKRACFTKYWKMKNTQGISAICCSNTKQCIRIYRYIPKSGHTPEVSFSGNV